VNLSDPTQAVTSALDGPVLAALAAAGRPLTVGQVAAAAARGSEIGVRRCLARLIEQGIVRATIMGRNQVHELNRAHIAAPIADQLADLRAELWRRFRQSIGAWAHLPVLATVFGSAARGDGEADSDIDLLLVHPPLDAEPSPRRVPKRLTRLMADMESAPLAGWEAQTDALRDQVKSWTGNTLQIVDLAIYEYEQQSASRSPLLVNIERDGIELLDRLTELAARRNRA
jgi:predicted nucleotidyltransferase